jgi:branched-subunit amino acid aminotransferase/4-amino-4-deoxychorismate lyase
MLSLARRKGRTREWVVRAMLYASSSGAQWSVFVEPLPRGAHRPRSKRFVAGIASYPHPGRYLTPPGATAPVKWMARGPLAHALREARALGWEEAILENEEGCLVEGTRSNLLAVVGGTLVAPGPESLALPGITRAVVLDEARRLGIPVREYAPDRTEVRAATELMVTSSLLGVASLTRLVGVWPGAGVLRRTPVGSSLREAYDARTRGGDP